jgi:2-methylcitrate dehydratase PrpD
MQAPRNCGERESRIEMRSGNSELSQMVMRSITTNGQAEAASQNAVDARAWLRREEGGRVVRGANPCLSNHKRVKQGPIQT